VENLIFTTTLVAPVFLIVALGFALRKFGLINDNFISFSSKIVFSVSLPALIFIEISTIQLGEILNLELISFAYLVTVISFLLSWLISIPFIKVGKDKSVFIQGSFRGNYAIVGLAIITNIYGTSSLGKASLLLAFIVPLYNILSVIALTVPMRGEKQINFIKTLIEIIKNPLIIAVIAAVLFSYFHIPVPDVILITVDYLSDIALPLALIGIGGYMSISDIKKASYISFSSTAIKLILIPLIGTYFAFLIGFRGEELGILFILFASPTAIVSFIMADAMGANSRLAGNILLITTLGSVITITIGIFILKENGLI